MNPLLSQLQPYPFERLKKLTQGITPSPKHAPISLGMGEPKHPTPPFIREALVNALDGLANYPVTAGTPALRQACAHWLHKRYGLNIDVTTQVLPVNGSREALFALAQTVLDPTQHREVGGPVVISPNPFYQVYEGAAFLGGARLVFVNADPARNFAANWQSIDAATWAATQLVFVCTPGNPTGAVMSMDEWRELFALSDQYGFVIAADECYSEIYFRDGPDAAPLGAMQAAHALGRHDFKRLIMFTSLSKRSNVPGMRSGFVAGDADIIKAFLLYRTYHGSAMGPAIQAASIAAWGDETHVEENRRMYREKFEHVTPIIAQYMPVALPDAGFYLWAQVPETCTTPAQREGLSTDEWFTRELLAQYNVTVLPGSYLARTSQGINPGEGRVRMALVAEVDECTSAAERIRDFAKQISHIGGQA
jgi:N-succinyldiaminopimelate aminotransferase